MDHAAEQGRLINSSLDIAFGFVDDFDRLGVACFGRISPGDQSVLLHKHQLCFWIIQYTLGNHFG
ncbi:hypothetical protein D3C77_364800 [compost metagenome]